MAQVQSLDLHAGQMLGKDLDLGLSLAVAV
jgi:hypothetical protein